MFGLTNQGRQNICCPIRASGTSGSDKEQLNSDLAHLASPAVLFSTPQLHRLLLLSVSVMDKLFASNLTHQVCLRVIWMVDILPFISQLSTVSTGKECRQGKMRHLSLNHNSAAVCLFTCVRVLTEANSALAVLVNSTQ